MKRLELFLAAVIWVAMASATAWGQISITNSSAVAESFDDIGSTAAASLPANWKMSAAGITADWTTGTNVTATTLAASTGSPTTGGRYNWATAGGTDRAIGFMTSGSYLSPNTILAFYRNTSGTTLSDIAITFQFERYRINMSTCSVAFYTSTDGSTWISQSTGDIPTSVFATGASSYTFSSPQIEIKTVSLTGVNIPNDGDFYLRWVVTNTGNSNSQGLGLDDVSVTATLAPTAVTLVRFNAVSFSDGVQLGWESGFEVNNLGYHLYREQQGKRARVTPAVVAGSALTVGPGNRLTAGYSYSWFDAQGTADTAYYLEAIDLNGSRQWTGPIYPYGGSSSSRSPKHERAPLLNEIASPGAGAGERAEQSWPAAMKAAARSATLPVVTQTQNLKPSSLATQQAIAAVRAVKIEVRQTRWYRLTQPELVAAGLDSSSDSRLLQLYVDGSEVPIEVSSSGPCFNAGDTLEFYGVALDMPTTDARTYWLINGDNAGKRIMAKRARVKPGNDNWTESAVRSFEFTSERREKLLYFASLLNGDAENLFGAPVLAQPVNQTLTIKNLDSEATAQPQLEVALQGLTASEHQVHLQVNSTDVGTITFAGREHPVTKFAVNRALLREGDNTVSLVAANGESDISLIDWIRLTYAHQYKADNNALRFSVPSGQTVRVSGFTNANVRVIDITDAYAPLELATTAGPSAGGYAVMIPAAESDTRTLLTFTDDLSRHPASVAANRPSSWNSKANGADMVIITHKDFRQVIEPLASLRRNQGLSVEVVDVEDVYDEFSYGAHTAAALRSFLSWAASHWSRRPEYLLLVGDSSWDPRNYLDQGNNDFVPTKLIDTGYMETGSDDWLADFNNTGLAMMAIGRLPGRTTEEVSLMVSKILSYEQERELNVALRGAVMVADSGFEDESIQTRALLPLSVPVQTINRAEVGNDDLVREQIVDALNQGPMIVNYYGHGSVRVWTGAGLLDAELAGTLTNTNRLSLYVMMTCLNGYAHDAYVDSLGESALKAPNGGAVAVWASSGFTDSQPQFVMNQEFYRLLFGTQPLRLGEATRNAKAAISDSDVRRTWALLGDPAMRMR